MPIEQRHSATVACALAAAVILWAVSATASQLVVDRGVRASGYWCLPYADDPLTFRYLPQDVRIARDADGRPMFSMIRYINPLKDNDAGAGALLTMILEYGTPRGRQATIQKALRTIVGPDATLDGPIIFESGAYHLTSSVAEDARVRFDSGMAPVLEGGRVAVSMQFEREASTRLWAALQAATPDLSVVFDMTYAGVHSSFAADVVVDWDKARRSLDRGLRAGLTVYSVSVGGEIEEAIDRMRNDGSISVSMRGEDKMSEELVAHIQEMATNLFFEPLAIEEKTQDIGNAADELVSMASGLTQQANQYFSLDFNVKYKRKEIVSTGTAVINIDKQGPASRHWSMVFNAGEIAATLRDDPYYVKTVDLRQAMPERVLDVRVDARLNSILGDFVDLVTVELRKRHGAADRTTIDQVTITPENSGHDQTIRLHYPRVEGEDYESWFDYEVRTTWRLKGAIQHSSEWISSRDAEVIVHSPVRSATIQAIGDLSELARRGVRAVVVEVRYPYFGEERMARRTALTTESGFDSFDLIVPSEDAGFRYLVTHVYGNRRESFESADKAGFILLDPGS